LFLSANRIDAERVFAGKSGLENAGFHAPASTATQLAPLKAGEMLDSATFHPGASLRLSTSRDLSILLVQNESEAG